MKKSKLSRSALKYCGVGFYSNLDKIPYDLESCYTSFSISGFRLSLLSSIMPNCFKLVCFDIGWFDH